MRAGSTRKYRKFRPLYPRRAGGGALPHLAWPIRVHAAGQGMVFGLSAPNRANKKIKNKIIFGKACQDLILS